MNFIAQVEENLRDLGSEARKKHPGVKEASERAILTLRSLQSQYVSAVRASTASNKNGSTPTIPHPTTALFRSQDVLRPFLLACNYPDASSALLLIGLNAIQQLISGDAVCPEDSVHIARVLGIQAACCCRNLQNNDNTIGGGVSGFSSQQVSRGVVGGAGGMVASIIGAASAIPTGYYSSSSGLAGLGQHRGAKDDEAISLKVLQTLTIMVASKELELGEEVLSQAVTVCLTLISGNEGLKDDRNKKKLPRVNGLNGELNGNGIHTNTIGGNDKMRRAAAATLKQILIFAFDRAEGNDETEDKDSKFLRMTRHAAASAFSDLCALSENRLEDERASQGLPPCSEVNGPFSIQGATGSKRRAIKPPPRSACFEMLNMIINHKPGLFLGSVSEEQKISITKPNKDMSDSFTALLRYKACPIVSTFLLSEYTMTVIKSAVNGGNHYEQKGGNGKDDFSLLMRSTGLACTIIQKFGKNKEFVSECHILLAALARFVSSSSEAIRDNEHFEDGFVYSTLLPPQQIVDAHSNHGWRTSPTLANHDHSKLSISNKMLWRCALALESLYFLTENPDIIKFLNSTYDTKKDEPNLVGLIAESISEFATTAASNKSSIMSVVRAVSRRKDQKVDDSKKDEMMRYPQIFARARSITKSYDDWESSLNEQNSHLFHPTNPSIQAPSFDEAQIPYCDDGEAIWVAFICTISLSSSLNKLSTEYPSEIQTLVECTFAPTIAVLQHFLKRFPHEKYIRKKVLEGFKNLVDTCIILGSEKGLHCEALVKSLCRLSLPNWGKIVPNCQLQDQHIDTIAIILSIMHKHHNHLSSNWHIILGTLDQLSHLSISSPLLLSSSYQTAMEISNAYNRISSFSTCLNKKTLQCFMEALIDLSKCASIASIETKTNETLEQSDNLTPLETSTLGFDSSDLQFAASSSIGNKLMSFAGRAFANQPSSPTHEIKEDIVEHRVHSSKIYSGDFLNSAFTHLAVTKPTTKKDVFRTLPFSLVLLTDVTLMNSFRFGVSGKLVTDHLCDLASTSDIPSIRAYAVDTLASLVTSGLAENGMSKFSDDNAIEAVVVKEDFMDNYLVVNSTNKSANEEKSAFPSQAELLSPLCETIAKTPAQDAAEAGLNSLYVILESSGHNLSGDAWPILIYAISASSGADATRSSTSWARSSTLAFRCLKLIVDDFLDQLPIHPSPDANATRSALLHCCASFGQSRFDVNTSLTATGMLWAIADQDPTPIALENVLSKLAFLACDERAEVRNCSVNTLFSCVVGVGSRFTSSQWKACMEGTIFGVFDKVSTRMDSSIKSDLKGKSSSSKPSRYQVSVHHSRDSNSKQWCATQVLTLRGMERVLRQFFQKLLSLVNDDENETPWFETAWEQIINFGFKSANVTGGRETMELQIAGVDILILCCQLSCKAGINASATPVRVGTNMQVVNGALRSVNNHTKVQPQEQDLDSKSENTEHLKYARHQLFLNAFDLLEKYTESLHNREAAVEERSYFSEPYILQVLTKVAQGLTKLFECCKDHEFSPNDMTQTIASEVQNSDLEERMVNMVKNVAVNAVGDPDSKYLNQAQRFCLDLLRGMCSAGSARAFEMLAHMGWKSFFWRPSSSDENNDMDVCELLELEAAKNASDVFVKEGVSSTTKAVVLSKTLQCFLEHTTHVKSSDEKTENDSVESYSQLIPVVRGGLEGAFLIEKEISKLGESEGEPSSSIDVQKNTDLLAELWDRMISTLSRLLSPSEDDAHLKYVQRTCEILEIISSCISYVPKRSYASLGKALSSGAIYTVEAAKIQNQNEDNEKLCKDCLKVFELCLKGLSKCDPLSSTLRTIAENSLRDALASCTLHKNGRKNMKYNGNTVEIEIEVAILVCDTLRTENINLTDLVIAVFPWLCKLTNLDVERVRQKAGSVLGSVDLARILKSKTEQVNRAEQRANLLKLQNEKLQVELNNLKHENRELREHL